MTRDVLASLARIVENPRTGAHATATDAERAAGFAKGLEGMNEADFAVLEGAVQAERSRRTPA